MGTPYSQYNYPLPKVSINQSQVGTSIPVSLGGSFQQAPWIVVYNESPFNISIQLASGQLFPIQAQTVDKVSLLQGDNIFFIVPTTFLPGASPTSEVDINVYPFEEPTGAYPIPLGRQSAPVSPTGTLGFSVTFTVNTTINSTYILNVFNPSNSGKKGVFTLAEYTGLNMSPSNPSLSYTVGADKNFIQAPTIFSNDLGASPPTSVMHATGTAGGALGGVTGTIRAAVAGGNTYEFINFPRTLILEPGVNLTMSVPTSGTSGLLQMTFEWTEQ